MPINLNSYKDPKVAFMCICLVVVEVDIVQRLIRL